MDLVRYFMDLEQQFCEMFPILHCNLLFMVIFKTFVIFFLFCINTYIIEQFKKFAKNNYVNSGEQLPLGMDLLTGSLAGGIAGAVTTPLDVVKTLLQTQPTDKSKKKEAIATTGTKHYSGIIEGLIWNYKNQGFAGLFRGIGPRVFWTSLQSAIMFVIYEQVLHVEEDLRKTEDWPPSKLAIRVASL